MLIRRERTDLQALHPLHPIAEHGLGLPGVAGFVDGAAVLGSEPLTYADLLAMRNRPWQRAGVSKARWTRAHRAVVGLVADLVWRARGRSRSNARIDDLDASMERLALLGRGDPGSTRYGLDLADTEPQDGERPA
ncbi:MAG: hypothetical protein M3O99_11040 [Chloroflexota bacterium]|nr:hypothetical protein [Chloroflexota bacterium]